MTGSGSSDLHAAVIRAADFDQYATNLFPGGVPNTNMIGAFAGFTHKMRGQACIADRSACTGSGVQPLSFDADLSLLQAAFRDHADNADGNGLIDAEFSDDAIGSGRWPDMTPREHASVRVPARVVASWVDGLTADSALMRYASHPNTPMQVVIGTQTHSNGLDGDPFARVPFQPARPLAAQSYADDITFVKDVLSGRAIGRSIRYRVMGTDLWRTSDVWPPSDVRFERLALAPRAISVIASTLPPRRAGTTAGRASAARPSTMAIAAGRRGHSCRSTRSRSRPTWRSPEPPSSACCSAAISPTGSSSFTSRTWLRTVESPI
jgi:predicted acyl esterase